MPLNKVGGGQHKWMGGLGLLLLLILLPGCREIPTSDWERVQAVRKELLRNRADQLFTEEFSRFEERNEVLRRSLYQAAAKSFLFRTGITELRVALNAQWRSGDALLEVVRRTKQQLEAELSGEVAVIEGLLEARGMGILDQGYRRNRKEVQIRLAEVRHFIEIGDFDAAARLIDELASRSSEIRRDLEEMENRYSDPELLRYWSSLRRKAYEYSIERPALLIDKYHRTVYLLEGGAVRSRFAADLGWNGWSDKIREGDGATPEGEYRIRKQKGPEDTDYFRALLLDYPNEADRYQFARAVREGRIDSRSRIGGMIELHGEGGRGRNWTDGCIALSSRDMAGLYDLAYVGMPVVIVGKCELE